MAIVDRDFTFRSVNPQFCKLLGVTPAELIGARFQDITPQGIRELDEKNAKLVIAGSIDFYILPKTYQFGERKISVVLLVTRAPKADQGDFQFFLSRIMIDANGELLTVQAEGLKSPQSSLAPMQKVTDFLMTYGTWLAGIGTIIGGILLTLRGIK